MPISSRTSFDNTGKSYKVRRILTADATLDVEKYKAYSPLLLSTTFAISYGLSFAAITATIMHTILFYRKQIWTQARRSLSEQADIHARLMSRYPQVPDWWYLIVFRTRLSFTLFLNLTLTVYHSSYDVRLRYHLHRGLEDPNARLGFRFGLGSSSSYVSHNKFHNLLYCI